MSFTVLSSKGKSEISHLCVQAGLLWSDDSLQTILVFSDRVIQRYSHPCCDAMMWRIN